MTKEPSAAEARRLHDEAASMTVKEIKRLSKLYGWEWGQLRRPQLLIGFKMRLALVPGFDEGPK